jgi:hypothetical protein
LKKLIQESITKELKELVKEAVDYAIAREFRLLREELTKPIKSEPIVEKKSKSATSKKSFSEMMLDEEEKIMEKEEILTENKEPLFKKGPFADILNSTKPFTKTEEAPNQAMQQQIPLLDRNALRARVLGEDTIVATTNDIVSIPLQDPDGKPINPQVLQSEEAQTVLKNITKDYSGFMKKVNEKTKQRRGQ